MRPTVPVRSTACHAPGVANPYPTHRAEVDAVAEPGRSRGRHDGRGPLEGEIDARRHSPHRRRARAERPWRPRPPHKPPAGTRPATPTRGQRVASSAAQPPPVGAWAKPTSASTNAAESPSRPRAFEGVRERGIGDRSQPHRKPVGSNREHPCGGGGGGAGVENRIGPVAPRSRAACPGPPPPCPRCGWRRSCPPRCQAESPTSREA